MRILALSDSDVFPPRSGEAIPIAAHIRALSTLGAVDLGCVNFDPKSVGAAPDNVQMFRLDGPSVGTVTKWWRQAQGGYPGHKPANPLDLVSKIAGKAYDLVYVGQLRTVDWALAAQRVLPGVPLMVNLCDSPLEVVRRQRRLAWNREFDWKFRLRCALRGARPWAQRWERELVEKFDAVLVQSPTDRDTVAASASSCFADRVHIARNGVTVPPKCDYRGHANQRLLHLGALVGERLHLVLWFARHVLQPLRQKHPQATLQLCGAVSPAAQAQLERHAGVKCLGFVDDLQSVIDESTVSIAPMMMRFGFINKAAESMAAGLPTTGLQAFSGFPGFQSGRHAVEVQSAAEWADVLDQLFLDAERLQQLSTAGREYATQLSWASANETVCHVAQSLANVATSRAA